MAQDVCEREWIRVFYSRMSYLLNAARTTGSIDSWILLTFSEWQKWETWCMWQKQLQQQQLNGRTVWLISESECVFWPCACKVTTGDMCIIVKVLHVTTYYTKEEQQVKRYAMCQSLFISHFSHLRIKRKKIQRATSIHTGAYNKKGDMLFKGSSCDSLLYSFPLLLLRVPKTTTTT